jgi:hypothetical protein
MPRRARFSKRSLRVADASTPSDPIWLLCENDGTEHPVFAGPEDAFPNRVIARAAWQVYRAACWASSERDGSKPPRAAVVYDGVTMLSYGRFITEADAAAPPRCPPLYASPGPTIGYSGEWPWGETRDPDGLFALFDAATELDIANATAKKERFPEIAGSLDDYVQSLRIRREIVAEGRDRSGGRNNDLCQAISDYERSQQRRTT